MCVFLCVLGKTQKLYLDQIYIVLSAVAESPTAIIEDALAHDTTFGAACGTIVAV